MCVDRCTDEKCVFTADTSDAVEKHFEKRHTAVPSTLLSTTTVSPNVTTSTASTAAKSSNSATTKTLKVKKTTSSRKKHASTTNSESTSRKRSRTNEDDDDNDNNNEDDSGATTASTASSKKQRIEKPCTQPGCRATFARSQNLRVHLASVHGDQQLSGAARYQLGRKAPIGDALVCLVDKCHSLFVDQQSFDLHAKTLHGINDNASCHRIVGSRITDCFVSFL